MKLEALLPYLLPDVPGVPDITALQALRLTAIDFCEKTNAWNETQDPIPLEDNVNEYDLDVEQGARINSVMEVWLKDRQLDPKTVQELALVLPDWQTAKNSRPSFYNAAAEIGVLRVYPIPLEPTESITVRVSYVPTLSATTVPDIVVNRYLDELIHGAKHRLMIAPGKGWSNPQLAAYHDTKFDEGVQSAKIDILHNHVQGSIRAKPVRFGS